MSILRPFRALRPAPEVASKVSAVPYDVVSREEALERVQGNPLSFLHLSRPEIHLPESASPYSDQAYQKARDEFQRITREAPLVRENTPSLYAYRLTLGNHVQTGIAATFSIDEYDSGDIRRHERTRQDKEDDRTRHIDTLAAQTGPVFLAYRDQPEVDAEIARQCLNAPLYDFNAPDGVRHTIWRIDNASAIEKLVTDFKKVPRLYIADGHHRAASACRVRKLRGSSPSSSQERDFMLAVAFPMSHLKILPYHRVIKDLNGLTPDHLLQSLRRAFAVSETSNDMPPRGEFRMYLGGRWYALRPLAAPPPADPIASLDVSLLQNEVLSPLFGILDPRTDKRIEFVGGIRGTSELKAWVDSGRAGVAFSLHPTSMDELLRVADADAIMPPKSTWFEPKLRDGLLTHLIDG